MSNRIICLVGMPGSGKSIVARVIAEKTSRPIIRFGDATEEEIKKRGLELNEENERTVREALRKEMGMDAYAKLNAPRIDAMLKTKKGVVVDGLYSWEEYLYLKERFGDGLILVAVHTSPATRYARLGKRRVRPLTQDECIDRDKSEIEKLNKGGPIAMADFVIENEGSVEDLKKNIHELVEKIR